MSDLDTGGSLIIKVLRIKIEEIEGKPGKSEGRCRLIEDAASKKVVNTAADGLTNLQGRLQAYNGQPGASDVRGILSSGSILVVRGLALLFPALAWFSLVGTDPLIIEVPHIHIHIDQHNRYNNKNKADGDNDIEHGQDATDVDDDDADADEEQPHSPLEPQHEFEADAALLGSHTKRDD